ncbi:enoyl-CoA hydratase/isomerase family protein [Saccharopolyspora mangrovi]|uniref:Enoyl-CoA hydratase/isomerase family protein n=1 Tax=Saccharopolyspora mangrovi TaxID=3082379 RepID=A0ABU6AG20_9PSEU|nr:enoyl-CoA hydratase/isomerase family protein [Saccharopolyspora sp. S2-29]MEB3370511.1 enoyl-CoA hydratase/isomerase family protein [Saccharopolyspora sp. S2-29]
MFSRPEKLNCMSLGVYRELAERILHASADDTIDTIVIGGTGRAFTTGGDLKEILAARQQGRQSGIDVVHQYAEAALRLFDAIETSSKTVVAMVNGVCQAGGLGIVLAADYSMVSDRATFAAAEGKVGLADPFVAERLGVHIGLARARKLVLTAEQIDAATALQYGMISEVVGHDQLEERTTGFVDSLAEISPHSRALFKRSLNRLLPRFDREVMLRGNTGADATEGLTAFVERRTPLWPSFNPASG